MPSSFLATVYRLKKFRLQPVTELCVCFQFTSPNFKVAKPSPKLYTSSQWSGESFRKKDRHLVCSHNTPSEHWRKISQSTPHSISHFVKCSARRLRIPVLQNMRQDSYFMTLFNSCTTCFLKFYVFDHVKITKCASPLVNYCNQPAIRQYAGCLQN